ncbi:hypothetical protein DFH27DRAFT_581186 [Peziza echinospora]|nr:hypothetical protein DFH27DRAFT_581186 [Peziza echinospora]
MLRLARDRGVVGMAGYVGYRDITDIAALRQGIPAATGLPVPTLHPPTKRRSGDTTGGGAGAAQRIPVTLNNRIYSLTVTAQLGVPVSAYTATATATAHAPWCIAHALLGGLVGHASLYFAGRILHRDVSVSNVLYSAAGLRHVGGGECAHGRVVPPGVAALHGFIIDLDYAVAVPAATGASGASHRTGTLPFISIGVLQGRRHAHADDLESFLYVLLWLCIGGQRHLGEWESGTLLAIATYKTGQMVSGELFAHLVGRFAVHDGWEALVEVAWGWRDVLFVVPVPGPGQAGVDGEWEMFVRLRAVLLGAMERHGIEF